MILNTLGIKLEGKTVITPATLNAWLLEKDAFWGVHIMDYVFYTEWGIEEDPMN